MGSNTAKCVACDRTDQDVPLVQFRFRGTVYHICSQHLPVLIHDPARLAGQLPDSDSLEPSDHQH